MTIAWWGCAEQEAHAKGATLTWEYDSAEAIANGVVFFFVYEAVGDRCDDLAPLDTQVGGINWGGDLLFERSGIPVSTGPVCYEVTAYNGLESPHSNRATALAETLAPLMPKGVSVGVRID